MRDDLLIGNTEDARANVFLSYRTVEQRERLKPFLFWMIVIAAAFVVAAMSVQYFPKYILFRF